MVSIAPLGLSLVLLILAQPVAALAARQKAKAQAPADDTGRLWVDGEPVVFRVALTVAVTQGIAVAVLAAVLDTPAGC